MNMESKIRSLSDESSLKENIKQEEIFHEEDVEFYTYALRLKYPK